MHDNGARVPVRKLQLDVAKRRREAGHDLVDEIVARGALLLRVVEPNSNRHAYVALYTMLESIDDNVQEHAPQTAQ
jgi:hypothetical protein